jgi:hypothetical protein
VPWTRGAQRRAQKRAAAERLAHAAQAGHERRASAGPVQADRDAEPLVRLRQLHPVLTVHRGERRHVQRLVGAGTAALVGVEQVAVPAAVRVCTSATTQAGVPSR